MRPSRRRSGVRASIVTLLSRRRRRGWSSRSERAVRISERTLARIHPGLTAPALVSVVRLPRWPAELLRTGAGGLVLVADGIEYAGNLGTLIRTADACGVDALVLTRATARVTHVKAFAASRGTVLTTPVLEYADVASARADLAAAGFTTYVADPAGSTSYRRAGLGSGPTAVVVGSEGDGVAEEWRTRADQGLDPDARAGRLAQRRGLRGGAALRGPRPCARRARADGPGSSRPPVPGGQRCSTFADALTVTLPTASPPVNRLVEK